MTATILKFPTPATVTLRDERSVQAWIDELVSDHPELGGMELEEIFVKYICEGIPNPIQSSLGARILFRSKVRYVPPR
jgi:hypothetical protein